MSIRWAKSWLVSFGATSESERRLSGTANVNTPSIIQQIVRYEPPDLFPPLRTKFNTTVLTLKPINETVPVWKSAPQLYSLR